MPNTLTQSTVSLMTIDDAIRESTIKSKFKVKVFFIKNSDSIIEYEQLETPVDKIITY